MPHWLLSANTGGLLLNGRLTNALLTWCGCRMRLHRLVSVSRRRVCVQDTILWWPLAKTMFGMFTTDPIPVLRSMPQARHRQSHSAMCYATQNESPPRASASRLTRS